MVKWPLAQSLQTLNQLTFRKVWVPAWLSLIAITEYHRLGDLLTAEMYYSFFCKPGKSKIKVPADSISGENPSSASSVTCYVLTCQNSLDRELFYKDNNPIRKGSMAWPNHLPKTLPPNTITWGIRVQHRNFEGTQIFLLYQSPWTFFTLVELTDTAFYLKWEYKI